MRKAVVEAAEELLRFRRVSDGSDRCDFVAWRVPVDIFAAVVMNRDQRDPDVIVQRRIELAEQVGLITAFGQDIAEVCRDAKIDVDFPEGIQFRPANMPEIETPVARNDPNPVP